MRLLLALVISSSFAACKTDPSASGPVGHAVARITQVPPAVGCVEIFVTGAGRTVVDTFDVTPGQSATLELGNLPVDQDAFSASAFTAPCSAIAGAQPSWSTVAPFYAPIASGSITSLTLTLEPTGGASIGIDFGGDGGGNPVPDLSPNFDGVDGGVDMAYTPADLAY
ncbi:MAG: hypothetical protein ACXVDD_19115 [Polyangia bacterium]